MAPKFVKGRYLEETPDGMRDSAFTPHSLLGSAAPIQFELPEKSSYTAKLGFIKQELPVLIQKTRNAQRDSLDHPNRKFLARLTQDINHNLNIKLPSTYRVNVCSTLGTPLSTLGGVSFFAEIYDSSKERSISHFMVDLKSDKNAVAGPMADHVFYIDPETDIYDSPSYLQLVSAAVGHLSQPIKAEANRMRRVGEYNVAKVVRRQLEGQFGAS